MRHYCVNYIKFGVPFSIPKLMIQKEIPVCRRGRFTWSEEVGLWGDECIIWNLSMSKKFTSEQSWQRSRGVAHGHTEIGAVQRMRSLAFQDIQGRRKLEVQISPQRKLPPSNHGN